MTLYFIYFLYTFIIFYIQRTRAIGEDAILLSVLKEGSLPANITQFLGDLDITLLSRSSNASRSIRLINPNPIILDIACAQGNDTSFLYEVNTRGIYRIEQTSGSNMTSYLLHAGISFALGEITYDWFNRNLYWTDSVFQWIILHPAYALENNMYRVIVERNLSMPFGLTVDPNKGFLFWSDISINPVIERSNLAGNYRKTIVSRSLLHPNSLVADETAESLFWTDNIRDTIETCSYSGGNRRSLIRLNKSQFISLALYKEILCVSDSNNRRFTCHKKSSGDVTLHVNEIQGIPWALALYDSSNRSIPASPCVSKSCEHICAAAVGGVAECICKEGYVLNQDRRTCSNVHGLFGKGVLFSNFTHICMLEIRIVSQLDHDPKCILKEVGATITHIETDTDKSLIFYSDHLKQEILIYNTINGATSKFTSTSVVSSLAYDWLNENLFWAESDTGQVRIVSFTTRSSSTVFGGLDDPKELTIDPYSSTLYWVEKDGSGKKIQTGKTDGTQKKTIISGTLSSDPHGLYFNTLSNRLYWEISEELRSSLGNGTDIKFHLKMESAKHLSIYKGYSIWTTNAPDIRSDNLHFTNIKSMKPLSQFGNITGFIIIDSAIQSKEKGPCEDHNGGCQEICFATQPGRKCQCSLGFSLQSDQTSCSSTPIYNNFLLTADHSHHKIYQISLDNKNVTALDLPSINSAKGLAYNSYSSMVVWSEIETSQIRQCLLTGENVSTIYTLGVAYAENLVIDHSTNNIYFSEVLLDSSSGSIRVVREGLNPKTIVQDLDFPRAIALYPSKGYLFFTDIKINNSYIKRCYMDGSSKIKLVLIEKAWINGLALDYDANRLYWTDGYHDKIESSDLNGAHRRIILTDIDTHIMDIVLDGTYLYYSAWSKQIITKVDKTSQQQETWMTQTAEFGRLDSIDIYIGVTHPVNSLCSSRNGLCSTYCLPKASGRTCACEDDDYLKPDGRTCNGAIQCSSSIPNGLISSCNRYVGDVCSYGCNNGYRQNTSITSLKCLITGQWNIPDITLCEEIKCPTLISHGSLENCQGRIGSSCNFVCDNGFQKKSGISSIVCLETGRWTQSIDDVCVRIQCSSSIPNGIISSCNRDPGDVCSYDCNNGYRLNTSLTSLLCLITGQWNVPDNTICEEIKCPMLISNGSLQNCQGRIGYSCNFVCDYGFQKKSGISSITCLAMGRWTQNINDLCVQYRNGLPIASIAGGAGGSFVFIVIIISVMVAICKLRQKNNESYSEVTDSGCVPDYRTGNGTLYSDIDDIDNKRDLTNDKSHDGPKIVSNNELDVDIPVTTDSYAFFDTEYLHPTMSRHAVLNQYENLDFHDDNLKLDFANESKETDVRMPIDIPMTNYDQIQKTLPPNTLAPAPHSWKLFSGKKVPPPVPKKPKIHNLSVESLSEQHVIENSDCNDTKF